MTRFDHGLLARRARADDEEWLLRLQAETHGGRTVRRAGFRRFLRGEDGRLAAVATHRGERLGYLLAFLSASHPRLLDVAVDSGSRRVGVATCLMLPLLNRYSAVEAVPRESCLAGQLLLKSLGFRCRGIWPRYYSRPPEDGYFFSWLR